MKLAESLGGRKVLRSASGWELSLRYLCICGALAGLAALIAAVSLVHGGIATDWQQTIAVLMGRAGGEQAFAVLQVRLPRMLLGFMTGWCVALAGAMLQSLTRNPLADPGLLGLSQGAVVAMLLAMVLLPGLPAAWMPVLAFVGGSAVVLVLLVLGGGGSASGQALVLLGIAVETVLSAVTAVLLLYTPLETSMHLSAWLSGSLAHATWATTALLAPWFVLSLPAIWASGQRLRAYDLGRMGAMALGEDVARSRPLLLLAAVLLVSAALTAAGPLMLLGVVAPQLARLLHGCSGRSRLMLSALMGGLLVVAADALSRVLAADWALPLGLSLMLLGAPVFILAMRLRAWRHFA